MKDVIEFPQKKRTEEATKSEEPQKLVSIADSAKFKRRMVSSVIPVRFRLGDWPFSVA